MGCGGSKSKATAATPAAQPAATAEPNAEVPNAQEAKVEVPAGRALQVKIASGHGLRPADSVGNKSDVFVEVSIEGKPASKLTSAVVSRKAAPRPGAAKGEKNSVEVELDFAGALQNFVEGDKVVFVVKDKDVISHDFLGKAVVTDDSFGGKLELEGAGDGYTAFLMVQLGEGSAMTEAIAVMKDAAEKAKQALSDAKEQLQDLPDTAGKAKVNVEDTQITGNAWCGVC